MLNASEKIKKFLTSPGNLAIIGSIILLVIVFIYLFANRDMTRYNNTQDSRNPENVISPISKETKTQTADKDYFKRLSIRQLVQVIDLIYNWQSLLDIFTFNPQVTNPKFRISQPGLENLSDVIKNPKVFYPGSSASLLEEYGKLIKDECKYYKLDWRLILAMIKQESAFTPDAVSHAGAYGFMQIMPGTGSLLEDVLQIEEHRSPENNLRAGIYYYASLVGRYHQAGDTNKYKFALAAYNCGTGHVEDAMTIAYYYNKNYFDWDVVSEYLTQLSPQYDTLHQKIWGSKPPSGLFSNWKEPLQYVANISYYWQQYKLIYPEPEDKPKKKSKKKSK